MDGVVLEKVHKVVQIHEWIVDGHNLGLVGVGGHGGSEGQSSDSSEAVDSESYLGHCELVLF